MYTEQMYENSLCHYGVKGQKWGERRFQNLDGTYTALGERRRLETLARTGTAVRPTSTLASRQQAARTGNVVRINSVNKATVSKPTTSTGGATKLVLDRATGTVKRVSAATTGNKALKKATKTATTVTKPTARLVTTSSAEGSKKSKKKTSSKAAQDTDETTDTTTSTSTGTTKKSSSNKKSSSKSKKTTREKQLEQQLKKLQEEKAAREQEQQDQEQEEKKDETQNEGSRLTDEQAQDYARRVIRGEFGNGQERRDKLGDKYEQVQALVNAILLKGKKK